MEVYPLVIYHSYGKSPFSMGKYGKSTISMAIFNSYVTNYQRLLCMYMITSGVELIWDYRCHSCSRKKMIWLKSGTKSWTRRKNSWFFRFPNLKSGAKSSSQALNFWIHEDGEIQCVRYVKVSRNNLAPVHIYIYILFIYLFIYLYAYLFI